MNLNAIRTLTIEGKSTGLDKMATELTAVERAQTKVTASSDALSVATDRTVKRQLSAAAAVERQRRADDDVYRMNQRAAQAMKVYETGLSQGVVTASEFAAAQERVRAKYKVASDAANENAKAVGLARHEMVNLGRQAQDVGTMLAMGASPMQVFTSQAAQVFDIFSSSQGTLRGFFGQVTGGLASMVTPARLAFGGIVAGAGAALIAVNQYLDAQKQIQMSLLGAGRATGATIGSVNAVANAGSSAFGLSVSEAREMASALVATGRVANDNLLPIVKIGKDIAHAFGVDAANAAKLLAQAMSDPVRGADMLNARLGFLDAGQRRQIENLVAQNRQWEAQRALIDGVRNGLTGIDGAVSGTSKGWTAVSNTISNIWDKLGGVVARALALEKIDLSEQIRKADERLAQLQQRQDRFSNQTRMGGWQGGVQRGNDLSSEIERETAARDKLAKALQEQASASARAFAAQQSFAQESAVRNLLPEIAQREQLNNQFRVLDQLMDSLANDEGAGERLRQLGMTFEAVAKAIEKAKTELRDFKSDNEKAAINAQIALDSVTAFSPGARADIARRQALEQNRGNPEAAARADEAYRLSLKQTTVALSEQRRERQLYSEQTLQSANLEVQLVGKSIAAQTEARMNLQARQTLEQEAARNRTAVDEAEYQRLIKINAEIAKKAQMRALADATSDAEFQSDTLFMSSGEQGIASTMRGIYGSEWQSQMNSTLASQLRLNNSLREYADIGRSAFTSVGQAMRDGKITAQEWSSILDNLSSRLMDLAMNSAWDALLGGRRGGGGGLFSFVGGLFGGGSGGGGTGFSLTGTGGLYDKGGYTGNLPRSQAVGVVHGGEYVISKAATDRIGVPTLEAWHRSALRGYEGGGLVAPGFAPSWVPPHANSNAPVTVVTPIQIINNSQAKVSTREEDDGRGGKRSVVIIDEMVAGAMGQPRTRQAMRAAGQVARR